MNEIIFNFSATPVYRNVQRDDESRQILTRKIVNSIYIHQSAQVNHDPIYALNDSVGLGWYATTIRCSKRSTEARLSAILDVN